ncbi:hypothetical protein [Fusibacter sp. JL216-2]|uniref:hypothetical protein n=1 Tax=Fusibacter sp. JL216-2 TaxID=3071453 RepID=UPI003D337E06
MKNRRILISAVVMVVLLASCASETRESAPSTNTPNENTVKAPKLALKSEDSVGEAKKNDAKNNQTTENERVEKWSSDIDQMTKFLKETHKDLYKNMSQTAFDAESQLLKNRISALNDDEIMLEIMRLIAKIGDGHTYLQWEYQYNNEIMPLKFVQIDGQIYCVNATETYKNLLFKKIVKIENHDIDTVFSDLKELVPAENDHWKDANALGLLRVPMFYKALGLSDDPAYTTLTYEDKGMFKQVKVKNLSGERSPHDTFVYNNRLNNIVSSIDVLEGENYWYQHDRSNKIIKINYDRCANTENYSFNDFNDEVWKYIGDNDIDKVAVDMRYNMGGGSSVFDAFRSGLLKHKKFNTPDRLFVMVGNRTFSSGVASATMTKRWTSATILGQETGGMPNSYGNGRMIQLENSGLILTCSTMYFEFYPGHDNNTLAPDVQIEYSLEDYKNNNDPVYNYVVDKSLSQ